MKYASKQALIDDYQHQWAKLWDTIDSLSQRGDLEQLAGPDDRSVADVLAHVYAWHKLLLTWLRSGSTGRPHLPAKGFKWSETRKLNQALFEENRTFSFVEVTRRIRLSHRRVMKIVESSTESELLTPGQWSWTGKNALASYITPNMSSHYRWAIKKLRKFS